MRKIISWGFILLFLMLSCSIDSDYNKTENPLAPSGVGLNKQKWHGGVYPIKFYISRNLERYGGQSEDDGQESVGSGYVNTSFNYIELRTDLGRWGGAYRFPDVQIPQGATINSVYISLVNYVSTFSHAVDSIACEDVDSATVISSGGGSYGISDRWSNRTDAAILWNETIRTSPPGARDSTPDLKTLVQEIVNRPNWKSGNAIIFVFKCLSLESDTSHLELYTWDFSDHTYGAILHVSYNVAQVGKKRILITK